MASDAVLGQNRQDLFFEVNRSVALEVGDTDRNEVFLVRHLTLDVIQHLALEEAHRIVVANRALEQALGIVRRAWRDDLEAGDMGEPGLERLRVLGGQLEGSAIRPAKYDRHIVLTTAHI